MLLLQSIFIIYLTREKKNSSTVTTKFKYIEEEEEFEQVLGKMKCLFQRGTLLGIEIC
jgi:uncharacterized membrane protein YciS (DUF1049 family)